MTESTFKRYETSYRHTQEFIKYRYRQDDLNIEEVNYQFVKDYEFFLKTARLCNHNSTMKYLKNFKKIIRIALANEWLKKDSFYNIKLTYEEVDSVFLEDHEIQLIIDKKISTGRLAVVRDIFLFCCYTGLAFSDVKSLKKDHLSLDNDNAMWIRKRRVKTDNMCNIPLMDIPTAILDKYKEHPICIKKGLLLPVLCNQKMNI